MIYVYIYILIAFPIAWLFSYLCKKYDLLEEDIQGGLPISREFFITAMNIIAGIFWPVTLFYIIWALISGDDEKED